MLQQRLGRFDPKGQRNRAVVHDLKQKSLSVCNCIGWLGSLGREGFTHADRHCQGRLHRMRSRHQLLERRIERGLLHHRDAAQQACLTFFVGGSVQPRCIGEDGHEVGSQEREPVAGGFLKRRYQRGVEILTR